MKKRYLLPLLGYLLLTVAMTWPTALHLTDAIPGDGFDGWQNYWNLWWVKQALLVERLNPFFTPYLDAPSGASLLFHTLNIFNGLWTLPVQLNGGLAVAYNSVVFFSFTLSGYGVYLLSLHTLTRLFPGRRGRRWAAFAGGLVFTMSPFHMAHLLGHMQVFSMLWPPFYVLWLLRTLRPWSEPDEDWPAWGRNVALCILFLVMASLVAWYHTLYLLLFTGLTLLWTLARRWRQRDRLTGKAMLRPLATVLAIGLGFGLLLSPLLLPMIRDAQARPDLETGLVQNITLSADLLAFVTPSEMHPLWGEWAATVANNFSSTTSERLIFAGFVPLALALFLLIRRRGHLIVQFWGLVTAAFFILALGPYLHIGGEIVSLGGWPLPLPYLLLYHTVPFIDLTRSLSRYDLMVMLGLGVLAALALVQLQTSVGRGKGPRRAIALLAAGLICFEFLAAPYPISPLDTPAFYFELADQPEDYTIAALPMNWDRPTPLLHQTVHGKRLLTAYTSRDNPLELAPRTPVFQQWRHLGPDIIDQPLAQIAPTIFHDFNLRYIVLDYWQMPPGPEREQTERWVAAALPETTPVYADDRLAVYQTPPRQTVEPYLSLGQGWGQREIDANGQVSRRLAAGPEDDASLWVQHPQGQSLVLEIVAASIGSEQTITVTAAGERLGQLELGKNFSEHRLSLPPVDQPAVEIRFQTKTGDDPVAVRRIGLKRE